MIVTTTGPSCTLQECPPGLFLYGDTLGFKSEYRGFTNRVEAFVVASGEFFRPGGERYYEDATVTPCAATWAND